MKQLDKWVDEKYDDAKEAIQYKYSKAYKDVCEDKEVYIDCLETLFPRTVLDAENYFKACDIIQESKESIELAIRECQTKSTESKDVGLKDVDISKKETIVILKKAQKIRAGILSSKEKKMEVDRQRKAKIQSISGDAIRHLGKIEETVSHTIDNYIDNLHQELNQIVSEAKTKLEKCCVDSNHNIDCREQLIIHLMECPKVFYAMKDEYAENEYISLGHLTETWEQSDGKLIEFLKKNRYFLLLQNSNEWDIITPEEYPEFSLSVVEAFCTAIYEEGYNAGHRDGYSEGESDGYDAGHSDGYSSGRSDGYYEGFRKGHQEGEESGYNSGYADGQYDS